MRECKSVGCQSPAFNGGDFCSPCLGVTVQQLSRPYPDEVLFQFQEGASGPFHEPVRDRSSGGDNDYWIAEIRDPKRLDPYRAECEDLIEHFQFTFAEGEAFKALWRKGKANLGDGKPGDSPLRNAEKVAHMGGRMVVMEQRKLEEA